jgi:hypothetical protein
LSPRRTEIWVKTTRRIEIRLQQSSKTPVLRKLVNNSVILSLRILTGALPGGDIDGITNAESDMYTILGYPVINSAAEILM